MAIPQPPSRSGPPVARDGCSVRSRMRRRFAIAMVLPVLVLSGTSCGGEDANEAGEPFRAMVQVADLDHGEVAYYERGEGDPLVMLIGTGSTMAEWDPAAHRPSQDRRAVD